MNLEAYLTYHKGEWTLDAKRGTTLVYLCADIEYDDDSGQPDFVITQTYLCNDVDDQKDKLGGSLERQATAILLDTPIWCAWAMEKVKADLAGAMEDAYAD